MKTPNIRQLDALKFSNEVIPPKSFQYNRLSFDEAINNLMVHKPIEQQICKHKGFYELLLCQKKSMSVKDYKTLVEKSDFKTEGKSVEEIENYVG